jgi:hypothetical protein
VWFIIVQGSWLQAKPPDKKAGGGIRGGRRGVADAGPVTRWGMSASNWGVPDQLINHWPALGVVSSARSSCDLGYHLGHLGKTLLRVPELLKGLQTHRGGGRQAADQRPNFALMRSTSKAKLELESSNSSPQSIWARNYTWYL